MKSRARCSRQRGGNKKLQMKNLFILILTLIAYYAFGQGPVCNYRVSLEKVDTIKYEYQTFIEDQDFGKIPLEYYNQALSTLVYPNENKIIKSENGKCLVFTQNFSRPCSASHQNGLKIIISRKNKNTGKIELMFTEKLVEESYTEIIFKKFKVGK